MLQGSVHVNIIQRSLRSLTGNLGTYDQELPPAFNNAPLHKTRFSFTQNTTGTAVAAVTFKCFAASAVSKDSSFKAEAADPAAAFKSMFLMRVYLGEQ